MKPFSEDPGSKDRSKEFEVAAQTRFVEPLKKFALRLKVHEVGLVSSSFGRHVIKRTAPSLSDALESSEMLQRAPVIKLANVKHSLLSYDQTARTGQDPRGAAQPRAVGGIA